MDTRRRIVDHSLVAKVVSSYVKKNRLLAGEMPTLISTVYQSLLALGKLLNRAGDPGCANPPICDPRLCCLSGMWLARPYPASAHTVHHGLTRDEYRRRWGLPFDHALVAPAYSERRSGMAKQVGSGSMGAEDLCWKAARPARRQRQARSDAQP